MCGIVGAVGRRDIVPVLLEGLRRLEYRGYDSAGVAVLDTEGMEGINSGPGADGMKRGMKRLRSEGRVASLARLVGEQSFSGSTGIAHTRWATHGVPSTRNAHPHVSGGVSVVHNGIIENHEPMRARLESLGYRFESDTDTEVIAHLVHWNVSQGRPLFEAVQAAMAELQGAFAIAVIEGRHRERLVAARRGAPLLLGLGDTETFAASDTAALLHVTQRMVYLEEGDCAEIGPGLVRIADARGGHVERPIHTSALSAESVELGPYRHFMQKEIFEQPAAIAETLAVACGTARLSPRIFGPEAHAILSATRRIQILACGTSFHAGMVARYWIESLAGVPCSVEIASEYRYRQPVTTPDTLVVAISQSGETADTLAAMEHSRSLGQPHSLAICNVPESALLRASTLRFLTRAGPEIGVASTKAFTTQLSALAVLALSLAKLRGRLDDAAECRALEALRSLPGLLRETLAVEPQVAEWASQFARHRHALFLGRGVHYPIAMEGALKLKEVSYIHAEAYAAGELKHGPLALVDREMPVVAIAPRDALFEKLKSNLQEVRARGGELYVFADREATLSESEGVRVIRLPALASPPADALLSPIVQVVPLQLLAYHTALGKGTDVDKPRNLAKSVTVE